MILKTHIKKQKVFGSVQVMIKMEKKEMIKPNNYTITLLEIIESEFISWKTEQLTKISHFEETALNLIYIWPKKKSCLVVLHRPPLIFDKWKKVFTVQKYTAPNFQNSKKRFFFLWEFWSFKNIF